MAKAKEQDQSQDQGPQNQSQPAEFTVPEGWASVMFDKAYDLQERYKKLVDARRANREALRALAAQDLLSAEEIAELADLYPDRSKKEEEGDTPAAPDDPTGEDPPAADDTAAVPAAA